MTEKVSDQNQITRFQYIEAPQQATSLNFVHTGQTSRSTWREKIIGSWIAREYIIYLNNKALCSKISKHLYRLYRDHAIANYPIFGL